MSGQLRAGIQRRETTPPAETALENAQSEEKYGCILIIIPVSRFCRKGFMTDESHLKCDT